MPPYLPVVSMVLDRSMQFLPLGIAIAAGTQVCKKSALLAI